MLIQTITTNSYLPDKSPETKTRIFKLFPFMFRRSFAALSDIKDIYENLQFCLRKYHQRTGISEVEIAVIALGAEIVAFFVLLAMSCAMTVLSTQSIFNVRDSIHRRSSEELIESTVPCHETQMLEVCLEYDLLA